MVRKSFLAKPKKELREQVPFSSRLICHLELSKVTAFTEMQPTGRSDRMLRPLIKWLHHCF